MSVSNLNLVSLYVCQLNQYSTKCKDMNISAVHKLFSPVSVQVPAAGLVFTLTSLAVTLKKNSGSGQPATVYGVSSRVLVSFILLPLQQSSVQTVTEKTSYKLKIVPLHIPQTHINTYSIYMTSLEIVQW